MLATQCQTKTLGAHYSSKHSNTHTPDHPFKATIIRKTRDHVDLKLMDAREIAENNPHLNTDSGWQLLPTLRKRVAREGSVEGVKQPLTIL